MKDNGEMRKKRAERTHFDIGGAPCGRHGGDGPCGGLGSSGNSWDLEENVK